jgi:DNA-binding MarR family transcriptional regulator
VAERALADQDADLQLLLLLAKVATAVTGANQQVLDEFGLTESTGSLLWALAPSTEPVVMRQLAKKLNFDPSNITLLSDRLERAGLVERRSNPADGRTRILALTPNGEDVWRRLITRVLHMSPLSQLSSDERRQLHALLSKVQI